MLCLNIQVYRLPGTSNDVAFSFQLIMLHEVGMGVCVGMVNVVWHMHIMGVLVFLTKRCRCGHNYRRSAA